jgi:hypothetical protein
VLPLFCFLSRDVFILNWGLRFSSVSQLSTEKRGVVSFMKPEVFVVWWFEVHTVWYNSKKILWHDFYFASDVVYYPVSLSNQFLCSINDLFVCKIAAFHWIIEFARQFLCTVLMFWGKHQNILGLLWSYVNYIFPIMKLRCKFQMERTAIYWRECMLCFASDGDTLKIFWRMVFLIMSICLLRGPLFWLWFLYLVLCGSFNHDC